MSQFAYVMGLLYMGLVAQLVLTIQTLETNKNWGFSIIVFKIRKVDPTWHCTIRGDPTIAETCLILAEHGWAMGSSCEVNVDMVLGF